MTPHSVSTLAGLRAIYWRSAVERADSVSIGRADCSKNLIS
jgi:hypothetical protein